MAAPTVSRWATLFVVMHTFASGGAAVTGEAISNGVPAFRKPEWKNARSTLVVMGSLLGVMFLGLSIMAAHLKVVPFVEGTPTVISQIGKLTYGGGFGHVLFFSLQAGTMLILVLAANTRFADFPRLASFQADDSFMPRQLTKRGHRLVFSNGIIFLAVAAIVLVIATGAKVDRLIPLYAVGVFTSFTLSQAGMAKHHLREREPHWRKGLFVNGIGAFLSLVVDVVIIITKFTHGAWLIIVLVPVMVVFLVRLSRQYATEAEQLDHDVPVAPAQPVLRRHVILVFVDHSTSPPPGRSSTGARSSPTSCGPSTSSSTTRRRGAHRRVGRARAHPHRPRARRLPRSAHHPDRGRDRRPRAGRRRDEVSVVLPERKYRGFWHRILHDQTADAIRRASRCSRTPTSPSSRSTSRRSTSPSNPSGQPPARQPPPRMTARRPSRRGPTARSR